MRCCRLSFTLHGYDTITVQEDSNIHLRCFKCRKVQCLRARKKRSSKISTPKTSFFPEDGSTFTLNRKGTLQPQAMQCLPPAQYAELPSPGHFSTLAQNFESLFSALTAINQAIPAASVVDHGSIEPVTGNGKFSYSANHLPSGSITLPLGAKFLPSKAASASSAQALGHLHHEDGRRLQMQQRALERLKLQLEIAELESKIQADRQLHQQVNTQAKPESDYSWRFPCPPYPTSSYWQAAA